MPRRGYVLDRGAAGHGGRAGDALWPIAPPASVLARHARDRGALMRNSNTGAFEVYDISHNAITSAASMGQVGLEWMIAGITADPPTGSSPAAMAQLVQAMAAFPSDDGAAIDQGPINQASQEGILQPSLFTASSLHHAV
jgi:hypothetical protein